MFLPLLNKYCFQTWIYLDCKVSLSSMRYLCFDSNSWNFRSLSDNNISKSFFSFFIPDWILLWMVSSVNLIIKDFNNKLWICKFSINAFHLKSIDFELTVNVWHSSKVYKIITQWKLLYTCSEFLNTATWLFSFAYTCI